MKELLLGNAAIALGAVKAGVQLVCGYPGTPSTEVLQSAALYNKDKKIHIEWSTNEKAALEVSAGASYAGERTMVTMKQVGLNVASDPLMSLAYIGVKGGMVVLVADDPGPISSQTEQDTRHFGEYSNIPVLDPSSPEEAYEMAKYAFDLSESIGMPVILRPTTKICHASGTIEVEEQIREHKADGFVKDPRWVIFPPLSYRRHIEIEHQQKTLSDTFSESKFNSLSGNSKNGIAAGGVTYAIAKDIIKKYSLDVTLLKIGTPFPAPEKLYRDFIGQVERILVLEELDPVIENQLYHTMALTGVIKPLNGKGDFFVPVAGELKFDNTAEVIFKYLGISPEKDAHSSPAEGLPARPPVLCAGCPHRASFYAVKRAEKGRKAVFCGDIGCYTLGNAAPLNMTDTCLCMGAGITIAQGIKRAEPDTDAFAFIGDSTFFASGMTGVANAVYNDSDVNIIVLDNSTTAMTGHQPHPGIGRTMMGTQSPKIDIEAVCRALNVGFVERINPFELDRAIERVRAAADYKGVSVIIFESPCVALYKPEVMYKIDKCVGCMKCINELGCPAMFTETNENGKKTVKINDTLCYGCGLCEKVCPTGAIGKETVK